jgi:hypothetical protein
MTKKSIPKKNYQRVVELQRAHFEHLAEFFKRATGTDWWKFGSVSEFPDTIKKRSNVLARRGYAACEWADNNLREFYSKSGMEIFREAKSLGGMKLVLGGSSRFLGSQLDSIRKVTLAAALYPSLAPFLAPLSPLAVVSGKYAWNKIAERHERRELSRSLMGVLAAAQDQDAAI